MATLALRCSRQADTKFPKRVINGPDPSCGSDAVECREKGPDQQPNAPPVTDACTVSQDQPMKRKD